MNASSQEQRGHPAIVMGGQRWVARYGWDICMGLLLISRSPTLLLCPMGGLRKTLQRPFTAHRVSVFASHSITRGRYITPSHGGDASIPPAQGKLCISIARQTAYKMVCQNSLFRRVHLRKAMEITSHDHHHSQVQ